MRRFNQFRALSVMDCLAAMVQSEQFRGRYPATKITTKMLYTVDFFSRPPGYFLPSEGRDTSHRTVAHDDTQWGGREPPPARLIRLADELYRVLNAITESASEWYTDLVARVFRQVQGHAFQHVRRDAPPAVISADLNLYTAVFRNLFTDLVDDVSTRDLDRRARKTLRPDGPMHRQNVDRVLHDEMMHRVLQGPPGGRAHTPSAHQRDRPQPGQSSQPPGPTHTVVPQVIRNGIPTVMEDLGNGKTKTTPVCLRFQMKPLNHCTFRTCKNYHKLVDLPADVLSWVKAHHGDLKPDRPQSRK